MSPFFKSARPHFHAPLPPLSSLHTRMHACTHARTHACTHARMHASTHARHAFTHARTQANTTRTTRTTGTHQTHARAHSRPHQTHARTHHAHMHARIRPRRVGWRFVQRCRRTHTHARTHMCSAVQSSSVLNVLQLIEMKCADQSLAVRYIRAYISISLCEFEVRIERSNCANCSRVLFPRRYFTHMY
jgi:hypothetical protein